MTKEEKQERKKSLYKISWIQLLSVVESEWIRRPIPVGHFHDMLLRLHGKLSNYLVGFVDVRKENVTELSFNNA